MPRKLLWSGLFAGLAVAATMAAKTRIDRELPEDNEDRVSERLAGSAPQRSPKQGGPNPWLVLGVALVIGIAIARAIDWRSHAPRD